MDSVVNEDKIYERVLCFFNNIYPLSTGLCEAIRAHSYITKIAKKQPLANIGAIHKNIYFIIEGAIRTFYIDKDGNDVTSWLLFEGDLAISVYSFYKQAPSFEAMEALEDAILLTLSHERLMSLYTNFMEFNYIGRTLTEQYYIRSEDKANALRMLPAKDRYIELLEKQPNLLNRVALQYIASYLGITQSTLSRIRRMV